MKFLILIILLTFFLFSCETKRKDISDVLASVDGKTLTLNKIQKLNPGLPLDKESLPLMVSSWVTNTVLLKKGMEQKLDKDSLLIKKRDFFFENLIRSSFLDKNQRVKVKVSNEEVLNYYNINKESFFRQTEEVFLEHYFTEESVISKKIKSFFNSNKKKDINISDFLLEAKTVKKGRTPDQFSSFIFESKDDIVGPLKSKKGFHYFKVLNRYKKGSIKGLELVYDEIFQRLQKGKEKDFSFFYLDSLKNTVEIYVNPKYQ